LVRYMTPELMILLRPYVTVLQRPVNPGQQQGGEQGTTPTINVNTMPLHLLRAFNSKGPLAPLGVMEAEQLAQALPMDGFYASVEDFKEGRNTSVGGGELDVTGLAVKTDCFCRDLQVALGEQRRAMQRLG